MKPFTPTNNLEHLDFHVPPRSLLCLIFYICVDFHVGLQVHNIHNHGFAKHAYVEGFTF
jgi:hypothetical protein